MIPSKIFDIWTKLEVLIEFKLSRLTDTLIETTNVKD